MSHDFADMPDVERPDPDSLTHETGHADAGDISPTWNGDNGDDTSDED